MATRYWVGGSGTWNGTSTANWSASSGGASGASVPTSADDVIFNAFSGTLAVTVAYVVGGLSCKSLTFTGASGSFSLASSSILYVYGSITLATGVTYTGSSSTSSLVCKATTTGNTITSAGKVFINITFDGAGGEWILQDAMEVGSQGNLTLTSGTLRTNGQTVTVNKGINISGSNTRALYLGASTVNVYGNNSSWDATTTTNLTFDAGTSTLVFGYSTAISFLGGSLTYNKVTFGPSVTNCSISGSNVISQLTANTTGTALQFEAGTVTSVTTWSVGSSTSLISLRSSSSGSQYEIEKLGGGTVTASGLDIKDSLAYPASTWTATNSLDSGNNTNWTFAPLTSSGSFFALL